MPGSSVARAVLALVVAGSVSFAQAGLFDDEEARKRIEALRADHERSAAETRDRLGRIEESVRNIGVVELLRQIEMLTAEVARLRGQIEVLGYQNEQLQKRQRDFYLDLDSRLKRLEPPTAPSGGTAPAPTVVPSAVGGSLPASAPAASAPSPAPTATPAPPATDTAAYQAAYDLYQKKDLSAAIESFRQFLKTYPSSVLAANAGYWLGISLATQKDFKGAMEAQREVVAKHPKSPKAPDALLAIAALQSELGDPGSARDTLEDVIAKYPGTEAASKARSRLPPARR